MKKIKFFIVVIFIDLLCFPYAYSRITPVHEYSGNNIPKRQKNIKCNDGYIFNGNKCVASSCSGSILLPQECKDYTTCKSGAKTYYTCISCYDGYILSGNKCTQTCGYTSSSPLSDNDCIANTICGPIQGYPSSCTRNGKTYYGCKYNRICSEFEQPRVW